MDVQKYEISAGFNYKLKTDNVKYINTQNKH